MLASLNANNGKKKLKSSSSFFLPLFAQIEERERKKDLWRDTYVYYFIPLFYTTEQKKGKEEEIKGRKGRKGKQCCVCWHTCLDFAFQWRRKRRRGFGKKDLRTTRYGPIKFVIVRTDRSSRRRLGRGKWSTCTACMVRKAGLRYLKKPNGSNKLQGEREKNCFDIFKEFADNLFQHAR